MKSVTGWVLGEGFPGTEVRQGRGVGSHQETREGPALALTWPQLVGEELEGVELEF